MYKLRDRGYKCEISAGLAGEAGESCERTGAAENHQVGTPTSTLTQASSEEDAGAAECASAAPPDEAPVATELSCDRAESEAEALSERPARRSRHKRRRAEEPATVIDS